MNDVAAQYEAFPYPARDPEDERKRLISGSPSHPLEIDHFVFGGQRDWTRPFRALVAGGGTGDALIQMAAVLNAASRPYEITYVDLSTASRGIAEARARVRGLTGIRFLTGSLLDAPDLGRFDYIDCCGVLHHLPDPQAGFDALSAALAPEGGMGLMVYAPYGRSGVYPLQAAYGALTTGMTPEARLQAAKAIHARLPSGHPFRTNPHLSDHEQSDAGFYDLLLHSQDRPFEIGALLDALTVAGLDYAGSPQAGLYDLAARLPAGLAVPEGLDPVQRMTLAEKLDGTIRTHIVYAVPRGRVVPKAGQGPQAVPHLKGVSGADLARQVERHGAINVTRNREKLVLPVDRTASVLLRQIDGHRSLQDIATGAGLDMLGFAARWRPVERALTGAGLLLYSRLLR
jgi:SAM-dependent methyltransferase